MTQGDFLQGTMLGLVITVGNQIVYYSCNALSDWARFRDRDKRDYFEVLYYSAAITINTIMDLWLVIVLAHGYMQDSRADTEAMIRNPTMQQALFVSLVGYLYPGTLLIPFMLEILPMGVLPYYLGIWMIRSKKHVRRSDAEKCLMCCPFDFNRYGDIMVNVVLVILCFFLTSVNLWWIFFWLFISSAYIYAWDHYRFLRLCSETHFNAKHMEVPSQYMSAVPCALLGAAFVFKLNSDKNAFGGTGVSKEDLKDFWKYGVFLCSFGAFLAHLVFHCLMLRLVFPRPAPVVEDREQNAITYKEVAETCPCNYFNSNPVHCLRSRDVYGHSTDEDPPHVCYDIGKHYLQSRNEKINALYQADHCHKEDAALSHQAATPEQMDKHHDENEGATRRAGRFVWPKLKRLATRESLLQVPPRRVCCWGGLCRRAVGGRGAVPRPVWSRADEVTRYHGR